jgi:hypothetical protein
VLKMALFADFILLIETITSNFIPKCVSFKYNYKEYNGNANEKIRMFNDTFGQYSCSCGYFHTNFSLR